jgi:DNA-binding transcriptional LysR family regulator
VELVTGTTGALITRVTNFEIEAALISEPFRAPNLAARSLFEEGLVLITPRAQRTVAGPSDLGRSTLIAFAHGCSYRGRIEIACVAAGTGFAVVSKSVLADLRAASSIRQHPLPKRYSLSRTHLVWNGDPSPALSGLILLVANC